MSSLQRVDGYAYTMIVVVLIGIRLAVKVVEFGIIRESAHFIFCSTHEHQSTNKYLAKIIRNISRGESCIALHALQYAIRHTPYVDIIHITTRH